MKEQSKSPKDEDILNQTQDPLERRRLQNRLSQRNHRRKIRERIEKLQERVIANELRAAAALNGWDQTYNPTLFPRSHSSSENELGFTSRDVSPLTPDQCTSFMPSYPPFSQPWPNDLNAFSQHVYPGDLSQFTGVSEASPMTPITSAAAQPIHSMSPPSSGLNGDTYREMIGTPETLIPDSLFPSEPNQPLYYVATEEALPQIIQVINTMSPQYKVIVLVPPESPASASIASFPSSTSPYGPGNDASEQGPPSQQPNSQNIGCLCHTHTVHSGNSAQSTSRPWTGGGSYPQVCPLHKTVNAVPPRGCFPVRMM
ncbi:hypothetical protein ACN38_g5511 [Penicillium nordicum]|uniref:BZIP domain-containing protein n=1 Tax=Penicillium nordicum TaxID=229535 RepID=A0A0M9WG64_9EURO|nr:hypothetical protein ACN38_g5511 [Penicillium nordicum]